MAIVNQTDAAVVRAPGGDAPQLSASTARTGSFANRRVSTREAAALEAVSQRSGRGRRGSGAVTSARRSLLSRFATVVKSAFGASRRTPDEPPRGTAHDEGDLAMGPVQRLKEFAADRIERGDLPPGLADDLQTAVAYAERLDKDNLRVNYLLDKSQDKTLTGAERRELSSLIGANKHNLALLQTWLGDRAAQLHEDGGLAPETRMLIDALSVRFGDRHMDLAELMSLYELDEILDEPVSRADRAGANLLHAEAALGMARELSPPGLDPSAKSRLVEDLEAHRDLLAGIQAVSSGRIEAPSDRLALASTELWHAPLPLVKPDEGGSGDIRALRSRWSPKAQGRSDGPWLPVAHQRVGQERMLQEFIRFRLADAGVAKNRMPDLEASLAESYTRVVNDQPWEPISARVRTTLPDDRGKNVVVESRIAPGKALAAHFPEDYPSNGINCADRTQYKHVPNLALTTLTNEKGRTLFSGLRHGVIDSYGIDGRRLARLPDDELRKMVGDLLVREDSIEPGGEGRDRAIDNLVAGIRSDRARAAEAAEDMRAQASRDMAREMAVAALVSNPGKFERALAGETVDIDLSSISLLTPDLVRHVRGSSERDERVMLGHQTAAFAELGRSGAVELAVRDHEGTPRTVAANVNVRQFNFGVNAGAVQGVRLGSVTVVPSRAPVVRSLMGWGFAMANNDPALRQLLGPRSSGRLEGDAAARVHSMLAEARDLRAGRLNDLAADLAPAGSAGPSAEAQRELAALTEHVDTLERNAHTLSRAAHDVKTIWENRDYRRGGGDPYKMVSRLALVSHLMGETPLFNCKSGKDRTGQLDAEVKFLATVADERDGHLPPVDRNMERWRSARNDFTMNTGNLEMQRLNTGLPGYKLAGVSGLKNMIADGMKPVYRGGSSYVTA